MKAKHFVAAMCCLLSLVGCGLKKVVAINEYSTPVQNVKVYQTTQQLPPNIIRVGSVVVGDKGMTPTEKCTYEVCVQAICEEARRAGADVVYLVNVQAPGFMSTCYNITAELYRTIDE